jgi:RES domain
VKIASPGAGVWRVGRTPDPIEFPDPPKADELDHPRAGNRFHSPTENFRVCYFATDLEACFGETLARFRPDPALIAAADEEGFMPHLRTAVARPTEVRRRQNGSAESVILVAQPAPLRRQ